MFSKQLLVIVLSLTITLQVVSGSTAEDAKTALQELYDLHANLLQNITMLRYELPNVFYEELNAEIDNAEKEIKDQVTNILAKFSIMKENVKEVGTDATYFCFETVEDDLNNFVNGITLNLQQCHADTIVSMNGLLDSTYNKVRYEFGVDYACNNMSFVQCTEYETEECFDFVIANIETSKERMTRFLKVIRIDLLDQTPGLNIPCRKMIVQEMDLYPSLLMKSVDNCLRMFTTGFLRSGC